MFTFRTRSYLLFILLGYKVSFLANYHKKKNPHQWNNISLSLLFCHFSQPILSLFFSDIFLFSLILNSLVRGILIKHALIADSDFKFLIAV